MAVELEIIESEIIKPSSPTPLDKTTLGLSLIDQFVPNIYTSIILYYDAKTTVARSSTQHEKCQQLKVSLSKTLNQFYPLAGRLRDNAFIECNDEGAKFVVSRIKSCSVSDVVENPDLNLLKLFLPATIESNASTAGGYMLLVQASLFNCGGIAIGMCISHKITDLVTLGTFLKCWSANTINHDVMGVGPFFMGGSILPPMDISIPLPEVEMNKNYECVTKRFVFTAMSLNALKAKASSPGMREPTRVEALSGLLWKCATNASKTTNNSPRPSIWALAINMRKRVDPELPDNYAGNFVTCIAPKMDGECKSELPTFVGRIKTEIAGLGEKYVKKLKGPEGVLAVIEQVKGFGELTTRGDIDFYTCTSWCRNGFYEADFGWGRPIWVSSTALTFKNVALLMDTSDGEGIEAWLTLIREDMALFESNEQLLQFAIVNPRVTLRNI